MKPADRLIVALDVNSTQEAVSLVSRLAPVGVRHFKVGLNLYTREGPAAIEAIHKAGGEIFLDLKFHDIPHTVAQAVRAAARLGVWMTNLHIQGGSAMMRAALSAAQEESRKMNRPAPMLIGVTVLTSMAEKDFWDLGLRKNLKEQVLYLAKLAKTAGLNGIVASAQEAKVLRWTFGEDFLIVTPGIRPAVDPFAAGTLPPKDDQQRTATPSDAIAAGADYLVVGRPILEAADPVKTAQEIIQECAPAKS